MQTFKIVTYTLTLTCLFDLNVESLQFTRNINLAAKQLPTPLKLLGDGLTKIESVSLFNPLKLYPSSRNTGSRKVTTAPRIPPLQPLLKNAIEANTKILELNPLKVSNSNPLMLPKFVTSSSKRITNVFKNIIEAPTLIDTAVRLFGSDALKSLKAHRTAFKPILEILVLLLQALQTYVLNTDPKEVSNVLGKIIDVLHELIHEQQ